MTQQRFRVLDNIVKVQLGFAQVSLDSDALFEDML
jgi:hypothetical protein